MGNFKKKMPKVKRSTQKGGPSLSKSGENQVEMYKKEMDTKARNVLCTIIPEKLNYLCKILDQAMWQPEYSLKAREFCINSIEEYEEKVKEIEELKKAQAKEEEETEEAAEENEEVTEGEENNEGEKLEGEPEEKKPKNRLVIFQCRKSNVTKSFLAKWRLSSQNLLI